jgi:hypothetical protein
MMKPFRLFGLILFFAIGLLVYNNCSVVTFRAPGTTIAAHETVTGHPIVASLNQRSYAKDRFALESFRLCIGAVHLLRQDGTSLEIELYPSLDLTVRPEGQVMTTGVTMPSGTYVGASLITTDTCETGLSLQLTNQNGSLATAQSLRLTFGGFIDVLDPFYGIGFNLQNFLAAYVVATNESDLLEATATTTGSVGADVQPLSALAAGEWFEIPNSQLRSVLAPSLGPDLGDPTHVITRWNGAALDTRRNQLILAASGGAGGYSGNEVYSFNLNQRSWSRLNDPSPGAPTTNESPVSIYPDGTPAARNTFGSINYIPELARIWLGPGGRWFDGGSTKEVWLFDQSELKWERKTDFPAPYESFFSDYDPVNRQLYVRGYTSLWRYNSAADSWTQLSLPDAGLNGDRNGVIDPKRRLFVMIGAGEVQVYPIDAPPSSTGFTTRPMTGDLSVLGVYAPGAAYDEANDRIILWDGADGLFTLDLDNNSIQRLAARGTPPAPAQAAGTFGRFRYVAGANAFVAVNSVDHNVFLFRLGP